MHPPGGRLRFFLPAWQKVTSDPWVLSAVEGVCLPWICQPYQPRWPSVRKFPADQEAVLQEEVAALLEKQAIMEIPVQELPNSFLSELFVIPKPNGKWRPIIDLRELNHFVEAPHFKMEGIQTMRELLRPGDFLGKIDLKDAYQSVYIHPESQPSLRFRWRGQLYQYCSLPFGLNVAPYVFTKLLRPVMAVLREQGIRLVIYLDDILVMGASALEAAQHLESTKLLLDELGFIINTEKSVFLPAQSLEYLGLIVDTTAMRIILPERKKKKIIDMCQTVLRRGRSTPLELAKVIGHLSATGNAVAPAPLYIRALQRAKHRMLQQACGGTTQCRLHCPIRHWRNWNGGSKTCSLGMVGVSFSSLSI